MTRILPCEAYSGCLNQTFRVRLDGGAGELELIQAALLPAHWTRPDDIPPYQLTFVWRHELPLPQAMYVLEHDRLGKLPVFLVPVGPDPEGRGLCYQAVFN